MPQHERGLYEPGDDVRVFDADEEEDVEGSRLPLLIVLALLVLAMFAGFVWLAYSEGVARGRGEAPVITADAGPARVAPANPGGPSEPYKSFKVYEQPAPPDDDTTQTAKQNAPAQSPPPAAAKPAAAPPVTAKAEPPKAAPVATPPTKPAPASTQMAAATPAPKPAAPSPAPKPTAAKPSAATARPEQPVGPATAPPRALNTATATPPAATPVKPATTPVPVTTQSGSGGSVALQIGAYKSQSDANTAWTIYRSKHGALLSGYSPDVQQADLGEKGTWYRLRIAGFPSKDVASALCDRLKADGGTCFLGK
ncbi:MAG TPA: SPOR domain-containing protein [Rhizomicrobium sp.]|jgi:hypothetical protein|nr:SPOR domain-containing protein [Rhizomicrobium sp.]